MSRTIDINNAGDFFKGLDREIKQRLRAAERASLKDGVRIAKKLSGGEYSSSDLRQMRHPYRQPRRTDSGRISIGVPPQDTSIANEQTGRLANGWRDSLGSWTEDSISSQIYNVTPEAKYFDDEQYPEGTDKMIARPLREAVEETLEPLREARIQKVLDTLL